MVKNTLLLINSDIICIYLFPDDFCYDVFFPHFPRMRVCNITDLEGQTFTKSSDTGVTRHGVNITS